MTKETMEKLLQNISLFYINFFSKIHLDQTNNTIKNRKSDLKGDINFWAFRISVLQLERINLSNVLL